jgi:cellulose synthase/poly-beta-1,6-N-acetylglucosamine synthase-like glycosyltransferase
MPLAMKVFLVLGTLLLLQSVWALHDGYRFLRYTRRRRRAPLETFTPPAAVIIPCKGLDADIELHLSQYLAQDYPNYQVVFVVASDTDPAYQFLRERLDHRRASGIRQLTGGPNTELVVAGHSESRGEKVNNLLHGLSAVDPQAAVLVFADMDARPGADWLRCLVAPLRDARVTVSTGFRWYLPGAALVSQLRAAWDTSIATLLGDHTHNFAWGGAMAIRAADFRGLGVAEHFWANTVSDDYALTRAVRAARGQIRFEPRCLVASREDSSWREFLNWANRQIIITRVYMPHLWAIGLAAYLFYFATVVVGLGLLVWPGFALGERMVTAGILLVIHFLGIAKGRIRSTVARETFPEEAEALHRYGSRYWQLAPLVPWVMLVNFLVAGVSRRIKWRGIRYHLRSKDEVHVIGREEL